LRAAERSNCQDTDLVNLDVVLWLVVEMLSLRTKQPEYVYKGATVLKRRLMIELVGI
jgi:hypothetical protein